MLCGASRGRINTVMIRLNKYLSNAGYCSRRKADQLITSGSVSVNGCVVTQLGTCVSNNDIVLCNGAKITLNQNNKIYVLFNKPINCITTMNDPEGRRSIFDIIKIKERIFPVGRLDRNTSGILLLTNDGEFAQRLSHPSFKIQKVYKVVLNRNLSENDREKIKHGVKLDDGFFKVDDIFYDKQHTLFVKIHSGRNRIVRRLFEYLNYNIVALDRIKFGKFTKDGLARGQWRFITNIEKYI